MLTKLLLFLVIVIAVALVVNDYMGRFASNVSEVVEITDKDVAIASGDVNEKGEILINDNDIAEEEGQVPTAKDGKTELIKNQDSSETLVSIDGFGNKIERKEFNNHARIKTIIVQTTKKGQKRVLVYSHTGKVKSVPQNMIDRVLNLTPDEVANAAGIYETRADKERRKEEMARAREERIRRVQMAEAKALRESMPDPVYREETRPQQSNESNENNQSNPPSSQENDNNEESSD